VPARSILGASTAQARTLGSAWLGGTHVDHQEGKVGRENG
jgi:hypothetical protein